MRLFLISVGTLIIALIIGLTIRLWGLSLPYKKFEHPFFDQAKLETQPLIVSVINKENYNVLIHKAEDGFTLEPKISVPGRKTVWVNIYITNDHILVSDYSVDTNYIFNKLREDGKFKGKEIHNYTRDELRPYVMLVPLKYVVESFKDHQFIFNVFSNVIDIHKYIVGFIEEHKLSEKVLINSPTDVIIKSIKEQRPMWAYGTSIPEAARLKSFATLGLEAAISIRGDVFIAPVSYLKRPLIDESLVKEMKRRKKYVFIGPVHGEDEKKIAEELNPDGIIF